jgi:hypothetical protein
MQTTQLAHGKITNADTLTAELIQPPDMPPVIRIARLRNRRSPHLTRTRTWPPASCKSLQPQSPN